MACKIIVSYSHANMICTFSGPRDSDSKNWPLKSFKFDTPDVDDKGVKMHQV